jgi:hypothetical protein
MKSLLIALLLTATISADTPPVSLELTPRVSHAPAWVRMKVTIPRDAQNQTLCLYIEGPESHGSCRDHDGESGAYRVEESFKTLPGGCYVAAVALIRRDGSKRTAQVRFQVLGLQDEPGEGCE